MRSRMGALARLHGEEGTGNPPQADHSTYRFALLSSRRKPISRTPAKTTVYVRRPQRTTKGERAFLVEGTVLIAEISEVGHDRFHTEAVERSHSN